MSGSRYLIGIDLGTTNSVVAYIDREQSLESQSGIHVFDIEQLAGPGELRKFPALPSFLYFPTEAERESGGFNLPWQEKPSYIVGAAARELGALLPSRQVASAKSWLCQDALNRTADILPREAEPPEPRISPVEASAQYLSHLRDAWNRTFAAEPESGFERQEIVLTVPASFDEEARELTVEAARRARLEHLTLLEEPLAAFYAWVAGHHQNITEQVRDGDLVLICDIGGGTSDFSLVRARANGSDVQFERTAIGEHLLLGGENLDLALARRVEQKIGAKLSLRQRHALELACSAAKEKLLGDDSLEALSINILGSGRAVVGQMLTSEVTRPEVIELLTNGFLPLTRPNELPSRSRSAGLREVGLPYASDPAITRHLAEFLRKAAISARESGTASGAGNTELLRPDAVLFNGGFCIPEITRQRIIEAIGNWFGGNDGWQPRVLHNADMGSAVAIGAAYYAGVRCGVGLRVKAGSARTYYIGMRSEDVPKAVCILPAGTDEGTTLRLAGRDFSVLANRPVSFNLFSSTVRHDAHGLVTEIDPEQMHRHAPLVTLLRYGKRLEQMELAVRMSVSFTEVGTLELWCESVGSPHRWRLQFELRGNTETQQASLLSGTVAAQSAAASVVSAESLEPALEHIRATFSKSETDSADPATLAGDIEAMLDLKRDSWPLPVVRAIADALLASGDGRRISPKHEARWLNLLGYCLRPGFGDSDDVARMNQMRRVYQSGLAFRDNLQNQVDWLVLWRRVSGGLAAAQQNEGRNYLGNLGIGKKKPGPRLNAQIEREGWRLMASLEHLSGATRSALGNELLRKLKKEPGESAWLWSLGRFGVRIPMYGALTCVVPTETAEEWIATILDGELTPEAASAIVQLARVTGDRSRDVSEEVRANAVAAMRDVGMEAELFAPLQQLVMPSRGDVARTFGEPLPRGIVLESTTDCLSPVSAITAG
jgi:molecular chaperone DnaK (HSP70)